MNRQKPERGIGSYIFSLNPNFGFIHGRSDEIVYPYDTKAEYLSHLIYEMKPVFYYGLQMDFFRFRQMDRWGFYSSLSLKLGLPGLSGIHENRDWASVENAELTHFSAHDNRTRELLLLDFSAGASFPFRQVMLLKTFINFSYMRFCFSGYDGIGRYAREMGVNTGIYRPMDDDPIEGIYKGKVINYSQEWLILSPGISFGYMFSGRLYTGLSVKISPLILCVALDEHLGPTFYIGEEEIRNTKKTQFRDYTRGGLFIEPGVSASFSWSERITLSLDFSWRYISGSRGESYARSYGLGTYSPSGIAGTGLSVLDIGFLFKIRL